MRPVSVTLPPEATVTASRADGLMPMLVKSAQVLFSPSFMRREPPSMYLVPRLPMRAALTIRGDVPRLTVYTARSVPTAPSGVPTWDGLRRSGPQSCSVP